MVILFGVRFPGCLARIAQSKDHLGCQITAIVLPPQIFTEAQIRIEVGYVPAMELSKLAFVVYIVPSVFLLRQISWRLDIYSTMSFHWFRHFSREVATD